jgi:hypothetical protein
LTTGNYTAFLFVFPKQYPRWLKMDKKIIRQVMTKLTVSLPVAGKALGELSENTSYAAGKTGQIGGCPVIDVAGKRRVPTAAIRRVLGLEDGKAA